MAVSLVKKAAERNIILFKININWLALVELSKSYIPSYNDLQIYFILLDSIFSNSVKVVKHDKKGRVKRTMLKAK